MTSTDSQFKDRYINARRKVISSDFSHLNEMQREAVMHTQGPLLLLAGAGSGKTTVLINRIANILKYGKASDSGEAPELAAGEDLAFLEAYAESPEPESYPRAMRLAAMEPAAPWEVIAITFTNKAAEELKSRLEAMLGADALDIWAMTFHSACVRILRRDIERLGFDRSFTIYDTADSRTLMKRIIRDLNLDDKTYDVRTVLNYISRAKDAMVTPEEFRGDAVRSGDIRKVKIGDAYAEYAKRMREANALDFDDLIYFTVKLLMEHEDVRGYYQRKFKYVLVDEYQDTNQLQYLLAGILAEGHGNICVVGDDDQSIYKFRGATIENILNFEKRYKNARTIRLEQNYRSDGHILNAANAVIRNNYGRKGKELWTDRDLGEKLTFYTAVNENDEAQYVASQIMEGYSQGSEFRDFAVLYRMNAQSNQMEHAFKRNGIPYRIIGGTGFFERAEIKDMLSYLCVINNPSDDLRLLRIINTPTRGIGDRTIEIAAQLAAEEGIPVYQVLKNSKEYDGLERAAGSLHRFVNLIEDLREALLNMPLDGFYQLLIDKTGYIKRLEAKDTIENSSRIDNVNELKSNIITYMNDTGENSLSGFLDGIALYTDIEEYDKNDDCVVMMTMHSAKGLEFPTVFIVGMEEGIFPGMRSIGEQEEMEEERRLCYVAMTRAKKKLHLTASRRRMLFGRTSANMASRFVEEIPPENVDRKVSELAVEYNNFRQDSVKWEKAETREKPKPLTNKAPAAAKLTEYQNGDRVSHKAFGGGKIVSVQPMGNDALIEIEFESAGKKRLMLKSASQYMEKV